MKSISRGKIFAKDHCVLIIILLIFAIIYSLISLVNHYNFRTYALDLGLYTNAMFDYRHLHFNDSLTFKTEPENLLADHFDLYLMLFSPLTFIMGSYTLLIVQIISVMIGACGVYFYFLNQQTEKTISIFAVLCFVLFFGIFSAISFDYHSNVVAAMLVPWFLLFIRRRKLKSSFLLLLFILISKENISLWMAFICLGLAAENYADRKTLRFLLFCFATSAAWFFAIVVYLMPYLSNNKTYAHFDYSVLGNSMYEAVVFIISHPLKTLHYFFTNHTSNPKGDYVKAELFIFLLLSGLYLLVKKPLYIVMLVPIFFQKLFNNDMYKWGIYAQYAVEFAPLIIIGAFETIKEIENRKLRNVLIFCMVAGNMAATLRLMDNTVLYFTRDQIRIYKMSHFKPEYNSKTIHVQLNKIPGDAIVSAQSPFVSHLALRDKIYQFPVIKDASFVIYSNTERTYPLSKVMFEEQVNILIASGEWTPLYQSPDFNILKKKTTATVIY
ncbi:MAG: DUF2079 domain-containing protein [Bacteroidia bacterium]